MKIGILASPFNPIQPGHLLAMKQAIECGACDRIFAAVNANPVGKRPPIWTAEERAWMINCVPCVVGVRVYYGETDLREFISVYRPAVLVVGEDHRNDTVTGADLGIPIFWAKRRPGWSSTEFVDAIYRHERDRRAEQASQGVPEARDSSDHRGLQG